MNSWSEFEDKLMSIFMAVAVVFLIILMVASVFVLLHITFNYAHALPENTTDWNWGNVSMWDDVEEDDN